MDKLRMESIDLTEKNIEKIEKSFPNVITEMKDKEGKLRKGIDFEKLKLELSENISDSPESYDFTWVGKKASIIEANTPIRKTLRPCVEESKDWESTQNLYIEGDNLEALKLLQESYLNSIKMIYIDPPYNTGNDFIYRDNFVMDKDEYEGQISLYDEEENRLFQNTESNGRFHSDWCSMLYSRLRLAQNLLRDDGAVLISIDENETANLIKICDEIFGTTNRIAIICHKSRASISNDKIISPNHNFILFYAKNINSIFERRKLIGLDPDFSGFNFNDDGKGRYRLVPVDGPGGAKKGNPYYEFMGVEGYFRFSKETMKQKFDEGLVVKRKNSLYQKYFIETAKNTRKTDTTWWDDGGLISNATSKLRELMGGSYFNNPKPLELILRMLKLITNSDKDSFILDFFSGSATTAHAVMQLNAEDGGNRKYIMVNLPELCDEKSEAYKAGYKNICDIGKERIRRAGEKIKSEIEENNTQLKIGEEPKKTPDIGFRVFKVDSTNMKDVYFSADQYDQQMLEGLESNIKEDRTDLDLLYGVMLDWGLQLSLNHKIEQIDGINIHTVDEGSLIACFADKVPESVVMEIAKRKPLRVVFKDSSFKSSPEKINVEEIFKLYAPGTSVKVI